MVVKDAFTFITTNLTGFQEFKKEKLEQEINLAVKSGKKPKKLKIIHKTLDD